MRGSYLHHKQIKAAQGVKIAAQNLESAVAGTQMLVAGPNDDIQALKDEVMEDMADIFSSVDRSGTPFWPVALLGYSILMKPHLCVVSWLVAVSAKLWTLHHNWYEWSQSAFQLAAYCQWLHRQDSNLRMYTLYQRLSTHGHWHIPH